MLDAGLYLQQMGQLCFHFGHYPQALELHLQANKVLKSQQNLFSWLTIFATLDFCIITFGIPMRLSNNIRKLYRFFKNKKNQVVSPKPMVVWDICMKSKVNILGT
jgi:hypothetical protein